MLTWFRDDGNVPMQYEAGAGMYKQSNLPWQFAISYE